MLAAAAFVADEGATAQMAPPRLAEPSSALTIRPVINGRATEVAVDPRTSLLDLLRERLALTGTKKGCDHGQCGACTVHVDGRRVASCLTLAAKTDGREVLTIEGLSDSGAMRDLQQAFLNRNALQCGYCTSGMLMAASELIDTRPDASREDVRLWISGNYCRCTGYQAIVDAICDVLAERRTATDNKGVAA